MQQKGKKISFGQLSSALRKGFEENFGVKLKKGKLAAEEKSLAKEIRENQFAAEQWNFKR